MSKEERRREIVEAATREFSHGGLYGTPVQDRVVWDNDLYRPVPDYWGVAVMIGHLHYHAAWETTEGTLTLELTGNHHSKLLLEYKSHREGAET